MTTEPNDTPMVCTVPGKVRPQQMRRALDAGRTVVLLSQRDTKLRQAVESIPGSAPVAVTARLGDGRTATLMAAEGTPEPFAYWPRQDPEPRWAWACRACGAVDERWLWASADEDAPMVRETVDWTTDSMVTVPWRCPRSSSCHGQPRWHELPA